MFELGRPSDCESDLLFAWKDGEIVLFGFLESDALILTRGWRTQDCFNDVRRWRFSDPVRFLGQVRRLVRATGAHNTEIENARASAVDWLQRQRIPDSRN